MVFVPKFPVTVTPSKKTATSTTRTVLFLKTTAALTTTTATTTTQATKSEPFLKTITTKAAASIVETSCSSSSRITTTPSRKTTTQKIASWKNKIPPQTTTETVIETVTPTKTAATTKKHSLEESKKLEERDIIMLKEILQFNPFNVKAKTKDRGKKWDDISFSLQRFEVMKNYNGRYVRERYTALMKLFTNKNNTELKASGIDADYSERDNLLQDRYDLERNHTKLVE